jgi:drug/metabolite transporter (DMT)-like permease
MKLRFYALGFGALMLLDTLAHVFFKYAATAAAPASPDLDWMLRVALLPWTWGALACYVATFFLWMTLLRRAPVGPAFAASHLEVVGVVLAGMLLFGEHIAPLQWAGAALILGGILCLALSEKRQAEANQRTD